MPRKGLQQCVFRGITINWPGNSSNKILPRTPTTTNPIKALLFAMTCIDKTSLAVIYIAQEKNLVSLNFDKNILAVTEEEKGYIVTPLKFIELCDGYITKNEAINILQQLKLPIPMLLDRFLFDLSLNEIDKVDEKIIAQFCSLAKPLLKKD